LEFITFLRFSEARLVKYYGLSIFSASIAVSDFRGGCIGVFRKPCIHQELCGGWDMIGFFGHQYTFTLMMATTIFVETMEDLHHSTRLFPKAEVTLCNRSFSHYARGVKEGSSSRKQGVGSQV
jgi:hypothetical protein